MRKAFAVLIFWACLSLPALADSFGQVEIRPVRFAMQNTANGGYFYCPLTIVNHDPTDDKRIEITSRGNWGLQSRQEIRVGAGKSVDAVWCVPIQGRGYGADILTVTIDGREEQNSLNLNVPQARPSHASRTLYALCSRGVGRDEFQTELKAWLGGGRSSAFNETEASLGEAEPEAWPTHWLAYSTFDLVVLTDAEYQRLSEAARVALAGYVECGGSVLVSGGASMPRGAETPPVSAKSGIVTAVGYGYGAWINLLQAKPWSQRGDAWPTIVQAVGAGNSAGQSGGSFTIVDKTTVPIAGIMACIVAFIILAGPVNIIVLDRMNRRLWLLWTTPVISLIFSVILLATFVLNEGLYRRGAFAEYTYLNELTGRAAVLGRAGFYCPISPSEGLNYSAEVEACPLALSENISAVRGERFEMTGAGWRFSPGLVVPRIPSLVNLRASVASGKRQVSFYKKDGQYHAVNLLGVPLQRLEMTSPDWKRYSSSGTVGAGEEVVLVQSATVSPSAPVSTSLRRLFTDRGWFNAVGGMSSQEQSWLATPGHYVARADKTLFLEPGCKVKERREGAMVYGLSADLLKK